MLGMFELWFRGRQTKKCHPLKYKKVYKIDNETSFETSLTFYLAVDVVTAAVTVVVVVVDTN